MTVDVPITVILHEPGDMTRYAITRYTDLSGWPGPAGSLVVARDPDGDAYLPRWVPSDPGEPGWLRACVGVICSYDAVVYRTIRDSAARRTLMAAGRRSPIGAEYPAIIAADDELQAPRVAGAPSEGV